MKQFNSNLESTTEETAHKTRLEIAEKCLAEKATLAFVTKVCSLTREEVIKIARSLQKKNNLSIKIKNSEKNSEIKQKMIEDKKALLKEKKLFEKQKIKSYKLTREQEAEEQRKIAAENTRLLLERIKKEQKQKLQNQELRAFQEENLEKKRIERQTKAAKKIEKESLEELHTLNAEQKIIASVGKCYLRGLNIEQAVLFSKGTREDVERIYKSFKKK